MALCRRKGGNLSQHGDASGTAAIEFALFIPMLFLLLSGTIELGRSMYEAMQVSNAVEAGMLYAAKNGWSSTGISNAVVNSSVVFTAGGSGLTAAPAPSQFCGCPTMSGITQKTQTTTNCNSLPPCADGSPVGQYVQVNASLAHLTIFPMPNLGLPSTLTATAILRLN
ncbi:MAG: TadE/TadG family type IV pilus assembly protein [Methylovirgula sp.]